MTLSKKTPSAQSVAKSTDDVKIASIKTVSNLVLDPNNNIIIRNGPQNIIPRSSITFALGNANAKTSGFQNDMHMGGDRRGWPVGMIICESTVTLECFAVSVDNDHWGSSPPSSNPTGNSTYRIYKDIGFGSVLQDTVVIANTSFTSHTSPGTLAATTWTSTIQTFGSMLSFASEDVLYITVELDNIGMTSNGAEITLQLITHPKH